MKKIQEEADNKRNVIDLQEARLALASKEPPKGGNWLSNLKSGTRFLASKKSQDYMLGDFMVATDPTKMQAVLLGFDLGSPRGCFNWVDPLKFSQMNDFYMTIETELEDGSTTVPTGTVEGDGEPQVLDSLHEDE